MLLLGAAASSSSTRVLSLIMGFCPFACTNLTSCRQMSSCVVNVPFAIHKGGSHHLSFNIVVGGFGFCSLSGTQSFCLGCCCIPLTTPLLISYPSFNNLVFVPSLDHHSLNTSRNALQTFLLEQAFSHLQMKVVPHYLWRQPSTLVENFPIFFEIKTILWRETLNLSECFTCCNENFKFN